MSFIVTIARVYKLHQLILEENTGTPELLACRLGISRANLFILISELKSLDLKISYSRKRQTFYYEQGAVLDFRFKVHFLNENELRNINGGSFSYFLPSNFLDGRNIPLHSYFANTESAHRLVSWSKKYLF